MNSPIIEIVWGCNFRCGHCMIGKAEPPVFMEVEVFRDLVLGLNRLGFNYLGLTSSGEILLHPELEKMLEILARRNMRIEVLTNGWHFRERLLPLLRHPRYRALFAKIGFSLDGHTPELHDENRRPGSFERVVEGAGACMSLGIPVFFKTAIRKRNLPFVKEMILFSSSRHLAQHRFITPLPTPGFVKGGDLPDIDEVRKLKARVEKLALLTKGRVILEGWVGEQRSPLHACNPFRMFGVDAEGNTLLCGVLAYLDDGTGKPSRGMSHIASLKNTSLEKAIELHFQTLARVMKWRLDARALIATMDFPICYWCYYQMGKLDWLKQHPESSWAAGILRAEALGITPMR